MQDNILTWALSESQAVVFKKFIETSWLQSIVVEKRAICAAKIDHIRANFLCQASDNIPVSSTPKLDDGMLLWAGWMIQRDVCYASLTPNSEAWFTMEMKRVQGISVFEDVKPPELARDGSVMRFMISAENFSAKDWNENVQTDCRRTPPCNSWPSWSTISNRPVGWRLIVSLTTAACSSFSLVHRT